MLIRHVLRNSLIPIISLWGLDMAQVIGGGAILTETVFNLHGVGQLAAESIGRLDIIPLLTIVLFTAFVVVALNAVIDILYAYLDPRIRLHVSTDAPPLLEVSDLKVSFATEDGIVRAVDGVSFTVGSGEVVAIVGESGSGKSVTAMTLMGLTRGPNARIEGAATLEGAELLSATADELQKIRGGSIAMVFQDPMSSLDPVHRIGKQIVEQIRVHDHEVSKGRGDGSGGGADGARRDSPRTRAAALISARVLGRDAPAGDDRDGALLLAEAADRRRTDDRARRDDPSADPRRAAAAARRRPTPA